MKLPRIINFKSFRKKLSWEILLILTVSIIIFFTPWIFTKSCWWVGFDFTKTGQIGDTMNGIAGPFITWIAAILVYISFKEQVKANKLLKEQNDFKYISDNINMLQNDIYKIKSLCVNAINDINAKNYQSDNLRRIIEIMREFQNTLNLLYTIDLNKKMLQNKIKLTWMSIYYADIEKVNQSIVVISVINGLTFAIGNPMIFNMDFLNIKKQIDEIN